MAVYLYLSTIPEALIASMLTPMDFGMYYSVGMEKKSRGQAQYFSVDRGFSSDYFPMSEIDSRCVPHPNGEPKHSVYLSVYRVLEHVPLSAIGKLYLATRDGRVLEIAPTKTLPKFPKDVPLLPGDLSGLPARREPSGSAGVQRIHDGLQAEHPRPQDPLCRAEPGRAGGES